VQGYGGSGDRQKMKQKTTFILLGIVIVLFAFIYAFELRKPDDNTKNSKKLEIILKIPPDSINKLEIAYTTPQTANLTLIKDNKGSWQSQPPSKDTKTISESISKALGRSILNTVKEPGNLNDYGLAKPRITLTFHLQDGTSKKIMLGNEIPTGNYIYLKDESLPDIYIVIASIVEDFTKLISTQSENNEVK
jgi:hypothetical protein